MHFLQPCIHDDKVAKLLDNSPQLSCLDVCREFLQLDTFLFYIAIHD